MYKMLLIIQFYMDLIFNILLEVGSLSFELMEQKERSYPKHRDYQLEFHT